jgi:hypothetical protein
VPYDACVNLIDKILKKGVCKWRTLGAKISGDVTNTKCGLFFTSSFVDQQIVNGAYKFCPYCGRQIKMQKGF